MPDGPLPLEQGLSTVGLSEAAEKEKRNGLSPKDKSLPVRQNIVRAYNHTPELWELGKVMQTGEDEKKRQVFQKTLADVKHFYGVNLVVKEDEELSKLTGNPENKATLREKTIFMAQSVVNNTSIALQELAHELGAFRLIQIYGSKEGIPTLPPLNGEPYNARATHYLDELVYNNGNKECLEPIRNL